MKPDNNCGSCVVWLAYGEPEGLSPREAEEKYCSKCSRKIEEEKKMTYKVTATVTMIVEAEDKEEAEQKATDGEWIEETLEVNEVEEIEYDG